MKGFGDGIGDLVTSAVERAASILGESVFVVAGFVIIPFWLVYAIKDRGKARHAVYGMFPVNLRKDAEAIGDHSAVLLKRFIRVQLLLALIVGLISWIGLRLLGVPYALPLALVLGFTELIVIIGPIIGGVIAVLVTLAAQPGWSVVWVLLLIIGIQQLENIVLVPRLQGAAIRMHPAIVIVLVVIAGEIFGLFGLIVVLPVTAVIRDAFLYIYRRLGEVTDATAVTRS